MISGNRGKELRRKQSKVSKVKEGGPKGNTSSKFTTTKENSRSKAPFLLKLEGAGTGPIAGIEVRQTDCPPKERNKLVTGRTGEEKKREGERTRKTTRNVRFERGKIGTRPKRVEKVRVTEPAGTRDGGLLAHTRGNRDGIINYGPKNLLLGVVDLHRPEGGEKGPKLRIMVRGELLRGEREGEGEESGPMRLLEGFKSGDVLEKGTSFDGEFGERKGRTKVPKNEVVKENTFRVSPGPGKRVKVRTEELKRLEDSLHLMTPGGGEERPKRNKVGPDNVRTSHREGKLHQLVIH
jgi:hypothetical protein